MKVIYLATPYSHRDPLVREMRYQKALKAEHTLISRGYAVLGPINMCHVMSMMYNMATGYEEWKERDREFIRRSDEVHVLMMHGWQESVGVTDEIEYAKENNIPVIYHKEGELLNV